MLNKQHKVKQGSKHQLSVFCQLRLITEWVESYRTLPMLDFGHKKQHMLFSSYFSVVSGLVGVLILCLALYCCLAMPHFITVSQLKFCASGIG